jgi:hypothetical protein
MRTPRRLKGYLFALAADAAGFRVPCAFCPAMLSYAEATVDHEPALALAGSHPTKAVLSCDGCNQARSRVTNDIVNARRRSKAAGRKSPKKGKRKSR